MRDVLEILENILAEAGDLIESRSPELVAQARAVTPTLAWTSLPATGNGLPPGMALSSGGILSGTPMASGIYTFTVQALDGITFDERTFTLTVN